MADAFNLSIIMIAATITARRNSPIGSKTVTSEKYLMHSTHYKKLNNV